MAILTINNAACNVVIYPVEYGLLYNWPAATDARKITSSDDWAVSTRTQQTTLMTYLGGESVAGGKLKEIGTDYWNSPNIGATNEVGFNLRGAGIRSISGSFSSIKTYGHIGGITAVYTSQYYSRRANSTTKVWNNEVPYKKEGIPIRLLYTGAGTPTSYTGNDGRVYRVVTIGTQTWLADNLSETRFRNGDVIPWHGANPVNYFTDAEWAALTTAGCCAYDNTLSNVAPGFTFPS